MKRIMFCFCLLTEIAMIIGLSGCQKITSASPDPNQIIELKPGDKVLFEVEGPVNTLTKRCSWVVHKKGVGYKRGPVGSNKFDYQTNPEGEPTNRITIECWAESFELIAGEYGSYFLTWISHDMRRWEIRILQDTKPTWYGTYVIEDDTDLHLLEGYTTITGSLDIYDDKMTSLAGLEGITTVGKDLYIINETHLTDLSGIENLTSVGGDLLISGNDDLTNLSGLGNLTSVGGDLYIKYNDVLMSLEMTGLQKVDEKFWIYCNPLLCNSLAEELRDQVLAREGLGGWLIDNNKVCIAP